MLMQTFEERVNKNPDNVAARVGDHTLTYDRLNCYANSIAHIIKEYRPGNKNENKKNLAVSLLLDHGIDMIAAILAVLKAGALYVPLSPAYPFNRIAYILEDSGASMVITGSAYEETVQRLVREMNIDYINIEKIENPVRELKPAGEINPHDPAYILYTSGSTGKPKGVVQTRENAFYYIRNWVERFSISSSDRMTLFSSFCHDGSVQDMFSALLTGAALYPYNMRNQGEIGNSLEIHEFLNREKITVWHSVPSLYSYFVNSLKGNETFPYLRFILLGGEPIRAHDIYMFKKYFPCSTLANVYGQTESSVNSTWLIRPGDPVKQMIIGKPLDKTKLFLVDEKGELAAPLEIGEILVACPHISPGYWNNEESTKKAFSQDPAFGNIYWTGDLGRLSVNGDIEFIGRKDTQVKIRGFRIETGEIETHLLKHELVKEAVVAARTGKDGQTFLAAYFLLHENSGQSVSTMALREYLSGELPDYMIPSYFIQMSGFTLTPSGKIDRKALPEPRFGMDDQYVAPRDVTEKKLTGIWGNILGIDSRIIGMDSNFFQLGGHSLRATSLVAAIHKEFTVKLPLALIFDKGTVRELARHIRTAAFEGYAPIEPVEKKEYYALSSAQKRLFVLDRFEDIGTSYNIPSVFNVEGRPDKHRYEKVFKALIDRHESLRTSFHMLDDQAVQRVHDEVEFEPGYDEISQIESEPVTGKIKNFIRPFDLSRAPLIRVELVEISAEKFLFLFDSHHIIGDGTSRAILGEDIVRLYEEEGEGEEENLPELKIQYKDFSIWQNNVIDTGKIKSQEDYWFNLYAGSTPCLNIPADYPRPGIFTYRGSTFDFTPGNRESRHFEQLGSRYGATLYMNALAAFNVLLFKYTGQTDIIVGSAAAGRHRVELQRVTGMFVNMLAMRNYPRGRKTYLELLEEVKTNSLKAFENQDVQLELLVEKLNIERDASRNPLFNVSLVVQNFERTGKEVKDVSISPYEMENKTTKFDLSVHARVSGDEIHFRFIYYRDLFKAETILRMSRHFLNIIRQVTRNPAVSLTGIDILTTGEKQSLLYGFNKTRTGYPAWKTIPQLFSEQVDKTPDTAALVYKDVNLTYRRLEEMTDGLGHYLMQGKQVKPDDRVGILMDRSLELVVSMVGILKSGAAYVPLDPTCPEERIKRIITDAGIEIVISGKTYIRLLQRLQKECASIHTFLCMDGANIDGDGNDFRARSTARAWPGMAAGNLAYVMYTSGSTGAPKGVLIPHRNVVNIVRWFARQYRVEKNVHVLLMSNYTFDASVNQIFGTLLHGGGLYVIDGETLGDSHRLYGFIEKNHIRILNFVPAVLKELLCGRSRLKCVTAVISGGVRLEDRVKEELRGPGYQVYNHYGPTETTIDALMETCSQEKVTLGKPVANAQCYIFYRDLTITPVNVVGELHVGGAGIARGYLNNPGLTDDRFIRNPYKRRTRVYRTGDLARWLPGGKIEFFGRVDSQVKIRGIRIEPGEIETLLLNHETIQAAVVISQTHDNGEGFLSAYVVLKRELPASQLREYLTGKLPGYMIPAHFIPVEKIPLNPNGKVDRNALITPGIKAGENITPPRDRIQQELINLWSGILNIDKKLIGIDSNFFELGGHSLNAAVLTARIHKTFAVKLSLTEIFKKQTVKKLSEYIKQLGKTRYEIIVSIEQKEYYTLSSAQKRMYILQQADPGQTAYNMTSFIPLPEEPVGEQLNEAFITLIKRHESLRTSFEMIRGEPVQRIHDTVKFEIESFQDIRPFDLSRPPLLRVGLIKPSESGTASLSAGPGISCILVVDMHHIISDGISHNRLKEDFNVLYAGGKLPAMRIQYKDYCQWQNNEKKTGTLQQQEEYWMKEFSGKIPLLNLPLDYTRPANQSFIGKSTRFRMDSRVTGELKKIASREEMTLYMVLLALFNILFFKLCGQEDIVLGTGTAGRKNEELQGIVGMFVNTLAIRNYPTGDKTFKEFLNEVKERTLAAFENQDYLFEDLVEKLALNWPRNRNPLFDVMLAYNNFKTDHRKPSIQRETQIQIPAPGQFPPGYRNYSSGKAAFDMTVSVNETGQRLSFNFQYRTKLFKEKRINMFFRCFREIVTAVTGNEEIKLKDIEISNELLSAELNIDRDEFEDFEF